MTLITKIGLFSTLHLIWCVAWGCLRIRIRLICTASLQLFTAFFETEYVKYENFRGLLYPFDLVNGISAEHLEYLMEIYIDYSGLSPQNRGPIHTKWQQSCKTLSANCCLKHKLLIIDHKIFFQAFKTLFLNLCQTFPFHRMRKKFFEAIRQQVVLLCCEGFIGLHWLLLVVSLAALDPVEEHANCVVVEGTRTNKRDHFLTTNHNNRPITVDLATIFDFKCTLCLRCAKDKIQVIYRTFLAHRQRPNHFLLAIWLFDITWPNALHGKNRKKCIFHSCYILILFIHWICLL